MKLDSGFQSSIHHVSGMKIVIPSFKTTTTKTEQTENNSHYILRRSVAAGQMAAPKTRGTDKWIQKITIYQSRKPRAETSVGTNPMVENPKNVVGELLEIQCGHA